MKKLASLLVSVFVSSFVFAQNVKIDRSKSNDMTISVEGYTSKKLYLGATVIFDKRFKYNNEYDFKKTHTVKGTISEKFTIPGDYVNRIPHGVTWIVALWEKKVTNCGCNYCKKNGFHMEGRVAKDTF